MTGEDTVVRVRMSWSVAPLAAIALAAIGTAEIMLDSSFAQHPAAPGAALAAVVAGALAATWWPILGTAVVATTFPIAVVGGLNGPTGAGVLSFFLAPGWAGYRGSTRRSWLAPLAAQLMASLGTLVAAQAAGSTVRGLGPMAWENLFFGSLCWGAWGVGLLARRLKERANLLARLAAALEAEREARERAVVVEERQRIARDMHDAVAHSLSVIVLQLGALRSTMPSGTAQADMMLGVERLGRECVQELRGLVGILRDSATVTATQQPSLAGAEDLVTDLRSAGLPVSLTVQGDVGTVPRAVDISAYRILQEALTNVLRHAGHVPTAVLLERSPAGLTLTVENEPSARGAEPMADRLGAGTESGGGYGLVGMRERGAVLDGSLSARPRPEGGFIVRADFPIGGTR